MTQYETAFLISPNLEEEETEKLIAQMAEVVSKKKGKMINEDRWGKRKLAYPIRKFEEAFYVFFHYEGTPEIPSELERRFKQTEAILRYLTVKKDTRENVRRKKKVTAEKETDTPQEEISETKPEETKTSGRKKAKAEEEKETDSSDKKEETAEGKKNSEKKKAAETEEGPEGDVEGEEAQVAEKEKEAQDSAEPQEESKED